MVNQTEPNRLTLAEAVKLREQANDLLNRLITDREQSERRLAEAGKRDPMKFVTGRTALEGAISTARELIVKMDELLARPMGEGATLASPTPSAPVRPSLRNGTKVALKPSVRSAHAVAAP